MGEVIAFDKSGPASLSAGAGDCALCAGAATGVEVVHNRSIVGHVNFDGANAIGTYKYVDFYTNGDKGAGNYTIGANAALTYSWTDGTAANTDIDVPVGTLVQSNIPNVWYIEDAFSANSGEDVYMVVAGDAIMYYYFENDQFKAWGAGAQL